MEDEGSHAEPGSVSVSVSGSTHTLPQLQPDNTELQISPSSAPCSPTPTGTLKRLSLRGPLSPTAASPPGQVSAITVVALLDKLVNMMEAVQENQQRMEQRQSDLEGAVRVVQGDVVRLSKTHLSTANSVNKLLERSRKVNGNVKEVKERLDRQAVQVRKLEANHNHLLKRNNFKVLIFQEDNEIPANVVVSPKTPVPSQYDTESTIQPAPSITGSIEGSRTQEEMLQKISLSSGDDPDLACGASQREEGDSLEYDVSPIKFERRSDRFKRSSLKKVDSIKKAFTQAKIGEKVNQITSKIVPQEKREKIKKSFTPSHPKSPTARASSFKISPMTFNVKKVRDGDAPTQEMKSTEEKAHVEIPALTGLGGKIPSDEIHIQEEVMEVVESLSPTTTETIQAEVSVNGKSSSSVEAEINGEGLAGLAVPEHDEDLGEDEEEEEEEDQEKQKSPIEVMAEVQITTETIAVEQVS
ncbi:caveolae-associated protein 2a isoform X1 [Poecilia formosa]|uniref:caveolae-associated protein 2a isoform X1 n=1 Tax=Poecilia formosa TaxID=48698 RepID=UPI00044396FD|nr:PREDICTED: serum deprivation-response protein-like isoform X1 [Poecilia formosa]